MKRGDREQDKAVSSLSRRDFLRICTLASAAVGLPSWAGKAMAAELSTGRKPSLIWLHFQECTGCTESLLRTSHPDVGKLILDLISLDYHETLFAASGHQIEEALHKAVEENAGKYILVVEGAIPLKDNGIYCQVGGVKATDSLKKYADKAGAVIALGSCASWGGIPSTPPNPTGATGVPMLIKDKPVVTLPGCPANPYNLLGTTLQYATFGTLPKLNKEGSPLSAYARTIHEDCPRRPHFDEGRFATTFGDEGHRQGYCLYKLGCKGPATHANCSLLSFGEVPNAWPVGIGHPCYGCTEEAIAFKVPLFSTIDIERATAPGTYPSIKTHQSRVSVPAAAATGLLIGAAIGGAAVAAKKLSTKHTEVGKEKKQP